ncbi:MAG: hypothetical protein ACRDHD_13055, partial [Candidatus Limnocylindria bacterium]
MRPDDLDRDRDLELDLAAAGERARSSLGHEAAPDRAFAGSLRDRLLGAYPTPLAAPPAAPEPDHAPEPDSAPEPRRWTFSLPRQLRLAPLALAAVLAVATVAGARELYVAFLAPTPEATP